MKVRNTAYVNVEVSEKILDRINFSHVRFEEIDQQTILVPLILVYFLKIILVTIVK